MAAPDIALTVEEMDSRAVRGDCELAQGNTPEGTNLVVESMIGARVRRSPNEPGYHPMMALMGASLGLVHSSKRGALVPRGTL